MRNYSSRIAIICLTILIGVIAVWLWSFKSAPLKAETPQTVIPEISQPLQPFRQPPATIDYQAAPSKITKSPLRITKRENFKAVVSNLKKLPAFLRKEGEQTFYISDVRYNEGEISYAYWKEENSIIILRLPLLDEPTEDTLYQLSGKAYFDLNKDVVPKMLDNMGCCLVTKAWANEVQNWCKAGYKLKFRVASNIK